MALTDNVQCALEFDENTGTNAADASGNGNAGTLENGATWGTAKLGASAASFDGSNDQVLLPTAGTLQLANAGAFTIMGWGLTTTVSVQFLALFSHFVSVNDRVELVLGGTGLGGPNDLLFVMARSGSYGSVNGYTNEDLLAINTWFHFAAVFDGSLSGDSNRMKIYFNGTQRTLTFSTTGVGTNATNQAATACYVGRRGPNSPGLPWSGRIDQFVFANRALTANEVSRAYNGGAGLPFAQWFAPYPYAIAL